MLTQNQAHNIDVILKDLVNVAVIFVTSLKKYKRTQNVFDWKDKCHDKMKINKWMTKKVLKYQILILITFGKKYINFYTNHVISRTS